MMAPLTHPLFVLSALAYGVLFALKKAAIYIPYLSDYGADLLAMPIILSLALWILRRTRKDRRNLVLPWTYIVGTVLFYGFLFEWYFPRISDRHTADPWDLLAYALGAVLFALFLNDPPKKAISKTDNSRP